MNPITESVSKRRQARQKLRLEALQKHLAGSPEVRAFAAFLATPAGAPLMRSFEETFVFGELQGDDALETAFNLGLRQFVLELRRLQHTSERTGDDDHT